MRPLLSCAFALAVLPSSMFITAHAAAPKGPSVLAKGVAGPPVPGAYGFKVDINARTVKSRTTGTFRGTVQPGYQGTGVPEVFTITGPVTCLSVKGTAAGVLYPVERFSSQGQATSAEALSILVSVVKGAAGDSLGFMGPLPTAAFTGCDPGMAPFTFTGTLHITP